MKRRMPLAHGHKNSATPRRHDSAGGDRTLNRGSAIAGVDHPSSQVQGGGNWRGLQHLDRVLRGHGARGDGVVGSLHQMRAAPPVAMAVQQCTDDSAVQHSGKRLVVRGGLKLSDQLPLLQKTFQL